MPVKIAVNMNLLRLGWGKGIALLPKQDYGEDFREDVNTSTYERR